MDNSVLLVLGMLLSLSQGDMGIPNCNVTISIGHLQDPCCLKECNDALEQTICEYECPKDMLLSHNMLWDKNGGYLCRHGCRQTCPDNYDGIRINDIQMCVECFILCRLEILHTSCKCQIEKDENEDSSLGAKDYIIIALAIALFLLVVALVMVGYYWKRKRNKDNTKTTENIEIHLQEDNSIKDEGNNQKTTNETEPVNDKHKTIAIEAQRKLDEKTRYTKEPSKPVVNTKKKRQSTKRTESATYGNAEAIGLNRRLSDRIPNLIGKAVQSGKGENMVKIGNNDNSHITNNDDHGNHTCEHDPDDDNPYQNVPIVSGGNSNRSTVILSDNGENGNQVDTYINTVIKSYETDRESSASSTESGAEAIVTQNTTNRQIQASGCLVNVKATNVTVIVNK